MRIQSPETDGSYDWRRDGWLAACALTAVLLIVSAATTHAPGFDTFLRLFVFCMALVRGFAGFRRGGAWLPLSAAMIAILFNPVRPIGMGAAAWAWCDLIAAAWFALVGAWRLLRSWDPQRGWAAAALSLIAIAVPAVAAFSAPNRDALTGATVDENLAVMNAGANAAAAAPQPDTNAGAGAATSDLEPATATQASAAAPGRATMNAPTRQTANRAKPAEQEVSAGTSAGREPPLTNGETASPSNEPADVEPINNESEANQEGWSAPRRSTERRLNK